MRLNGSDKYISRSMVFQWLGKLQVYIKNSNGLDTFTLSFDIGHYSYHLAGNFTKFARLKFYSGSS